MKKLTNLNNFSKANIHNVFAITGGISTGKSTVINLLKSKGYEVISSDKIAHDIIMPKSAAWNAIKKRYGQEILEKDDNSISRTKLADIIFKNDTERKFVESITHPIIKNEIFRLIDNNETTRPIFVEVPLLYEVGWNAYFDGVIVVSCDIEIQIDRCMKKLSLDRDEAVRRIMSQMSLKKKIQLADIIIDNNGDLKKTDEHVKNMLIRITNKQFRSH